MRLLPSPLPRALRARTALPLAAAFLALASVVHAAAQHTRRRDPPIAMFTVSGTLRGSLAPGVAWPIDIMLGNRTRSQLWVTNLRVTATLDGAHVAAGCSVARDFAIAQLPRSAFPIRLPAAGLFGPGWPARLHSPGRRTWWLGELGVRALPTIAMVDLAQVDQDGCKGAQLRFSFRATARRGTR